MNSEKIFEPVLNFSNKELSSYIYENCFQSINLNQKELEPIFIKHVLKNETIKDLCNYFLTYVNKYDIETFNQLKHEKGFDIEEVVDAISEGLKKDFQNVGTIFQINKMNHMQDYEKSNPLTEMINSSYMKAFCDGLSLTYKERAFFILCIANEEWGWLFPNDKSNEYKSHLFAQICEADVSNEENLTRKINNHLMQLGLLSAPWKINRYVYSFFKGENPSFSLQGVTANPMQDVYDYKELWDLNESSLSIMSKQINEYRTNKKGCWQIICSNNDFRNKNFLADRWGKNPKLHELKQELAGPELKELEFYIYALSLQLKNTHGILFLPESITKLFISNGEKERNIVRIKSDSEEHIVESSHSILEKIQVPVILSMVESSENSRKILEKHGINVLYEVKLNLSCYRGQTSEYENAYKQKAMEFFYNKAVPENMLCSAVNECQRLDLNPEKWDEVAEILKNATTLSTKESAELIRQKYSKSTGICTIRKNSHYCIEALNVSESVIDLVDILKSAKESFWEEYNNETGLRVLLYGISGGGKTAYVEHISNLLGMTLKIIRASEILGSYVGDTEKNISTAFEEAAKSKSILLIDEADSFLHCRGDNLNHHNDSKVNQFLIEMERFPGILFCNTNLPENLDSATDRRFHFKVGFKPLTKNGITLLCRNYFKDFEFSENQISQIYNSGEVTPGDFGALNSRIRFVKKEKLTGDYITEELCKMIAGKKKNSSANRIGFCCD